MSAVETKGSVPKGITSTEDMVKEMEEDQLRVVREALVKASQVKNPRDMWLLVHDTLNLLTLILAPEVPKASSGDYPYKPK